MIIYVAGYPKSGTTLLRLALNALLDRDGSEIQANELLKNSVSDSSATPEIARAEADLFHADPTNYFQHRQLSALHDNVRRNVTAVPRRPLLVKSHSIARIHGHCVIPPDLEGVRVFYAVRNPLDICVSMAHFQGISHAGACSVLNNEKSHHSPQDRHIPVAVGSWRAHFRSWTGLSEHQVDLVKFESMIADLPGLLRFLCRNFDLNVPTDRLNRIAEGLSFERLRRGERTEGFIEAKTHARPFFRSGKANDWADKLEPEFVDEICRANEAEMRQLGYLPAS